VFALDQLGAEVRRRVALGARALEALP
jgi:hypothetical protein